MSHNKYRLIFHDGAGQEAGLYSNVAADHKAGHFSYVATNHKTESLSNVAADHKTGHFSYVVARHKSRLYSMATLLCLLLFLSGCSGSSFGNSGSQSGQAAGSQANHNSDNGQTNTQSNAAGQDTSIKDLLNEKTSASSNPDNSTTPPASEGSSSSDSASGDSDSNSAEGTVTPDEPLPPVVYPLAEGGTAPDFTALLTDGSTFYFSDQRGKVVLLNFWATWCGPCVMEMPAFQRIYEEYPDQVSILAVNLMEDPQSVDSFIQHEGYTFPVAYDYYGDISMTYPSDYIPYTMVIDQSGIIRNIYVGADGADAQYQEYKSAIDALLN